MTVSPAATGVAIIARRFPVAQFAAGLLAIFLCSFPLHHARGAGRSARGIPAIGDAPKDVFLVLPFENRSKLTALAWMRAALPVSVAEKLGGLRQFRPVFEEIGLAPNSGKALQDKDIFSLAKKHGANWVWTGFFERPEWKLTVGVRLWRVVDGERVNDEGAVESGEGVELVFSGSHIGKTTDVQKLIGKLILESLLSQDLELGDDQRDAILAPLAPDFFSYTLLGKGVAALVGLEKSPDVALAARYFDKAHYIAPHFAAGSRFSALTLQRQGGVVVPAARLEKALAVRPQYPAALRAAFNLHRKMGRYKEAGATLEKLLAERPYELSLRLALGRIYWQQGRPDAAALILEELKESGFDDPQLRRLSVLVSASTGEKTQFISELTAMMNEDPNDIATLLELAAAFVSEGQTKKAIPLYEKVISLRPDHGNALKFLGDAYRRLGRLHRAIRYYGKAVNSNPADPRAYFMLAACYVEVGDDQQARRIYTRAQRFEKYLPDVYNNLGALAYKDGKLHESLWYLRRATLNRENKPRYHYNYALSLSATRRVEEALREIDTGLRLTPDDAEMHYLRGVILLREGSAEEAKDEFTKTLSLAPGHEEAAYNLERLEALLKRSQEGAIRSAN